MEFLTEEGLLFFRKEKSNKVVTCIDRVPSFSLLTTRHFSYLMQICPFYLSETEFCHLSYSLSHSDKMIVLSLSKHMMPLERK